MSVYAFVSDSDKNAYRHTVARVCVACMSSLDRQSDPPSVYVVALDFEQVCRLWDERGERAEAKGQKGITASCLMTDWMLAGPGLRVGPAILFGVKRLEPDANVVAFDHARISRYSNEQLLRLVDAELDRHLAGLDRRAA